MCCLTGRDTKNIPAVAAGILPVLGTVSTDGPGRAAGEQQLHGKCRGGHGGG